MSKVLVIRLLTYEYDNAESYLADTKHWTNSITTNHFTMNSVVAMAGPMNSLTVPKKKGSKDG